MLRSENDPSGGMLLRQLQIHLRSSRGQIAPPAIDSPWLQAVLFHIPSSSKTLLNACEITPELLQQETISNKVLHLPTANAQLTQAS